MSSQNTRNRTVLYLRVSTADQKPDLQFDGLRRYAERAELTMVGEYLDTAVSVRKQGRPQLDALIKAASLTQKAFEYLYAFVAEPDAGEDEALAA